MQETYRCIVADDDEIDRLTTLSFIKDYPFLEVAGSYDMPLEAMNAAKELQPEILFLDIDMPGMSGLELRAQLPEIPVCIFITSYPDYALDSYDAAALDFLVKPFTAERFDKAIKRAAEYLSFRNKAAILNHTLGADTIFIKDGHQQLKLQLHEIIYLEALKDYTSIVTAGKKYCVLSMLSNLLREPAFDKFVRIHRSYAVQKHFVKKIGSKEIEVGNYALPVGRTFKDAIKALTL